MFRKWLAILLIACLLLSGAALTEEAPEPEAVEEVAAEAVEAAVEEETPAELEGEAQSEAGDFELIPEAAEEVPKPLFAPGGIAISEANFPDAAFRSYIKAFDADKNDQFSTEELKAVDAIQLTKSAVKSLTGIAYFTNLQYLMIEGCGLTAIDVSKNTELLGLYCSDNKLTSLDVTKNTKLQALHCDNNQLTALDVTHCAKLETLYCCGNKIATLDISQCPGIAGNVKGTGKREKGTISFESGDTCWLWCDDTVKLVGGSAVIVPAVKVAKSMKYKVNVGVLFQIDPNGAGKSYKSSSKKVATVNSYGLVTPKAAGKAKITFKVGKKKRTLTLTVADPTIPTKVTLDKTGTVKWYKQDPLTLTATLPAGTTSPIKWQTSNKKVAKVSGGKLTFKKAGTVTITATATRGKKKAKVRIKVIDGSRATAIKIETPATTTLKVGEKLTLTAAATIARPADPGKPTVDPKARWTSSNKKVLAVNKTTGEITARKPGTATVTVTAGSKKKAKIKIKVIK